MNLSSLILKRTAARLLCLTFYAFSLMCVVSYGQTNSKQPQLATDTPVNNNAQYFASPWVWVVGVAVFILLLVALMRGGTKRNDY